MLYMAVGTDFTQRKTYTQSVLEKMQAKRPDAQMVILDSDSFSPNTCEQFLSSVGLFDEKSIIVINSVCETKEHKEYLLSHLQDMINSDNAFVLSENKLTPTEIKKIKDIGVNISMFAENTKPSFSNIFVMGDLLLQKNKQKLLLDLYTNTNNGTSIEEIVGVLLWQLKSLLLCQQYSEAESGLKNYVYKKCKQCSWSPEETMEVYKKIINHYHQSRLGGLDLFTRIELSIMEL